MQTSTCIVDPPDLWAHGLRERSEHTYPHHAQIITRDNHPTAVQPCRPFPNPTLRRRGRYFLTQRGGPRRRGCGSGRTDPFVRLGCVVGGGLSRSPDTHGTAAASPVARKGRTGTAGRGEGSVPPKVVSYSIPPPRYLSPDWTRQGRLPPGWLLIAAGARVFLPPPPGCACSAPECKRALRVRTRLWAPLPHFARPAKLVSSSPPTCARRVRRRGATSHVGF